MRGIDTLAALFGAALAILLLRAGRAPGRFQRGITLGLAAGTVAWVVVLHASPWTLLVPLLVGAVTYLRIPRALQSI